MSPSYFYKLIKISNLFSVKKLIKLWSRYEILCLSNKKGYKSMREKKHSMKKLIVLLFLVFFLFGCSNCSDVTRSYDNCWTDCKLKKLPDNFCKKACKHDLR
jgi:hypothetical protein